MSNVVEAAQIAAIRAHAEAHRKSGRATFSVSGIEVLLNALEEAEDKLASIRVWCNAYPVDIFPEPDFKRVRELLEAGGITIDSVSASNMRRVLKGVREIIDKP